LFPASTLPAAVQLALPQLDNQEDDFGQEEDQDSGLRLRGGGGSKKQGQGRRGQRRGSRYGSIESGDGFWTRLGESSGLLDIADELDDEMPGQWTSDGSTGGRSPRGAADGSDTGGIGSAPEEADSEEIGCLSLLMCSEDKDAKQKKDAKAMRAASSIMRIQRRMMLGEAPSVDTPRLIANRSSGLASAAAPTLPGSRVRLGPQCSEGSVSLGGVGGDSVSSQTERQASAASLVHDPTPSKPDGLEMSTVMSAVSDDAKASREKHGGDVGPSGISGQSRTAGSMAVELLRGAHAKGLVGSDGRPSWQPPLNGAFEFCGCLRDTLLMGRHALIARNF